MNFIAQKVVTHVTLEITENELKEIYRSLKELDWDGNQYSVLFDFYTKLRGFLY